MFLCVHQIFIFPLEMVVIIKNGLLEAWNGCQHQKWPPWGQAFLCLGDGQHGPHVAPGFLLLPLCSCCGWVPPSKWLDRCQPLWSLQTRKWTYGTHAPDNFTQHLFLSSLTPRVIDYFDYFWPCPLPVLMAGLGNFICNLFGTPKWQAFYRSLYKIDNFGWNNQVMWSAVSVSVSIAPWRAR